MQRHHWMWVQIPICQKPTERSTPYCNFIFRYQRLHSLA